MGGSSRAARFAFLSPENRLLASIAGVCDSIGWDATASIGPRRPGDGMHRKPLIFALAFVTAAFWMPAGLLAQTPSGLVSGRAVDASGRGVANQRVELVQNTLVVSTVTTDVMGDWSFAGVAPGDYVVRMNIKGHIAGVRVSVASGQMLTGTLIVVPTAVVAPQLGVIANLTNLITTLAPTAAAAVTSAATAVVADVKTTVIDEEKLVAILAALSRENLEAFTAAILTVIQNNPSTAYAQYQQQFKEIEAAIKTTPAGQAVVIPPFPKPSEIG